MATVAAWVLLGCCAMGPAISADSDSSDTQEAPAVDVYRYALNRAMKQASEGELEEVYPALLGVIRSPVFEQLESQQRHWALFVAGLVALDLNRAAEAH